MNRRADDDLMAGLPEPAPASYVKVTGERDFCFVGPFDDTAAAESWVAVVLGTMADDCRGFAFSAVDSDTMRALLREHAKNPPPILRPADLVFH